MPIFDTIVACITGNQLGAVAIVRLSGPESWQIASNIFHPFPTEVEARKAVYGCFSNADDGFVLPFLEGSSYTGEESVECNIHGSRAAVQSLIDECCNHGARLAKPGEFTERAFLNGRIDLTQAEGIRDTIEAQTEIQHRQAALHREGSLRGHIEAIRNDLIGELAGIEASVDFSEEIGEYDRSNGCNVLVQCLSKLEGLESTARAGRLIRNGIRIAIVGLPNAGKSSLLNAILGRERTIVTPIPGTTRDYIEESAEIGGLVCTLIDTAGLQVTEDIVEQEGISRTRSIIESADAVWYVFDANEGWGESDELEFNAISRQVLKVTNKIDLCSRASLQDIAVSAKTGQGLDDLHSWVQEFAMVGEASTRPFVNDRQVSYLKIAIESCCNADETLRHGLPADLAVVQLTEAIQALGLILGVEADTNLLDEIFSRFCIGK